jgi:hypothetical protein
MLLLLKVVLVPILIGTVTLVARRWGSRVGGLVMGLPIVAGPTLCFYAVEQGDLFAASATRSTLLGLVGVAAFCLAYARSSTRLNWQPCLLIGWFAFGVVTAVLHRIQAGLVISFVAAVAALLLARALFPTPRSRPLPVGNPAWDLPLRMLAAAALVLFLTSVAARLGPGWSGVLTPFPVATAIIAGFSHAQGGSETAIRFLHGYIPGLCSFALFCVVLAATLPSLGLVAAFAFALAVQLVAQGILFWSAA